MKNIYENYGLLSEEQVFGDAKLAVLEATGALCKASDFAVLSGADVSEEGYAKWFLSSAAGSGDVCAVGKSGERIVAYATAEGGVRPVLSCEDISIIEG